MMERNENSLVFSFPEVHQDARCTIVFQRTLRVPSRGGKYPVPPGLGRFRLEKAEEIGDRLPPNWERNGSFFHMYQSEALLVIFIGWYPFAVRVSSDGVNALTGRKIYDDRLWRPADYIAFPRQPWMEWFCLGNGKARQFAAMPLQGEGGEKTAGKLAISVHPMTARHYDRYRARRTAAAFGLNGDDDPLWSGRSCSPDRGGSASFDTGSWEVSAHASCSVYPVNTDAYMNITGKLPEGNPPLAADYISAGLPWKKRYGADFDACWKRSSARAC